MEISEDQYKFNLAVDLIYYLMLNLIKDHPNKIEMVQQLIDKWDARVNTNIRKQTVELAKVHSQQTETELDVSTIIMLAHQHEEKVVKKEFKQKIKEIIIQTMMLHNKPE